MSEKVKFIETPMGDIKYPIYDQLLYFGLDNIFRVNGTEAQIRHSIDVAAYDVTMRFAANEMHARHMISLHTLRSNELERVLTDLTRKTIHQNFIARIEKSAYFTEKIAGKDLTIKNLEAKIRELEYTNRYLTKQLVEAKEELSNGPKKDNTEGRSSDTI